MALAFVVLRTIRLLTALFFKRENMTGWKPDVLFFRTRLGHYAACLILGNILLTISRLIDFSGLSDSGLSVGEQLVWICFQSPVVTFPRIDVYSTR